MRKKILLLTTGGTIASKDSGSGLAPVLSSQDFLQYVKEFEKVCELIPYEVCSIDSTNMDVEHWLLLARIIQQNYDGYDAFLVCHGTDTMAYTAAALSYLIQNSAKPIVLTGAQKSILSEITDARKNLHDSIRCALDKRSRDVRVVFDGKIIAGTRAKKTSTFSYDAFSSINFPDLADVIKALGFAEYFDDIIVSACIGYDKPRKEIFAYVKSRYPNEQYIMVGDSVTADIAGGNQAGMKTILVHNGFASHADLCVDSLSDIDFHLMQERL